MEKKNVAAFFDRCAAWWDADMIRNEPIIAKILDNAGVKAGADVLDVACGTGVLFPDYLSRRVASVTGIDISGGADQKSGGAGQTWRTAVGGPRYEPRPAAAASRRTSGSGVHRSDPRAGISGVDAAVF